MVPGTKNIYKQISKKHIDELSAIYDDFLYIVRQHELACKDDKTDGLASEQMVSISPDSTHYSWEYGPMSVRERQDFKRFINDDVQNGTNAVYVILQYIKEQENMGYSKYFSISPYDMIKVNMPVPSSIERCSVIYPTNGTLDNVTFYVDGQYKLVYKCDNGKNMSIQDAVTNYDMLTSLCVMINITKAFCNNKCTMDKKFQRSSTNICVAERLAVNENVILELLGSFAEKLLSVCREIYNTKHTYQTLQCAQQDGLIQSADDFRDYINLRHFMRHQWDGLDYFGSFDANKAIEHEQYRNNYVNSYLKLCDKTLIQRMKTYLDVLHQMQFIMQKINPYFIVRDQAESNNKFFKRVKSFVMDHIAEDAVKDTTVELNYELFNDKYNRLIKNFYKWLPIVNIKDALTQNPDMVAKINHYNTRSWFLNNFNSADCLVMRYCLMCGHNFDHYKSWEYVRDTGVITSKEYDKWHEYTDFRNLLSHNYFGDTLRKQLRSYEKSFEQDLQILTKKILDKDIKVRKVSSGVCAYLHQNGLLVRLDYNNHNVVSVTNVSGTQNANNNLPRQMLQKPKKIQTEVSPTGIEFGVSGNEIISVKLPIGITINLYNNTINWYDYIRWDASAEQINTLQTDKSQVLTDKNLRVIKYIEKKRKLPVRAGDSLLIGSRQNLLLDSDCRIKEIKSKSLNGNIMCVSFSHKQDGSNVILFADGTKVVQSGKNTAVVHNGKTLTFDNRQEFAATYINPKIILQQAATNEKIH